jgi:hypothetical protein
VVIVALVGEWWVGVDPAPQGKTRGEEELSCPPAQFALVCLLSYSLPFYYYSFSHCRILPYIFAPYCTLPVFRRLRYHYTL